VSTQEQPQQEQQQRSLYRRHRPRTFAEVVGQEPVVRTLRNAVERGKVHHAYLFVGSRGTGKTSMAKILAACLNCERGGPTTEPCGECDSCVSIARASSLDVIEMDAASNNSVDDIRELRESVAYAPVSGRRKVYILDEAHMLSTAAWNAFLKTLEEPPPNTVFVLATTEAGKVPATVVDRCHRFDFHRPTVEQIASVVRRAAQAEQIEIPPAAVAALARSATGSFRDALGTLEQIVTYGGAQIALEDVLAVLGVADARLLEETVDAVAAGDARRALQALAECAEQGRDAGSFAADLEVRARELLVTQTLGQVPEELSLTPEADAALQAQSERVDRATIVALLELLGAAMEGVRAGADPRTRLELALVKAARPEVDVSIQALLARIERLERERGTVSAVALERDAQPGRIDRPVGEQPSVRSLERDAQPGRIDGPVGEQPSARSGGEGRAAAESVAAPVAPDPGATVTVAIATEAPAMNEPLDVPVPGPMVGAAHVTEMADPITATTPAAPSARSDVGSPPPPAIVTEDIDSLRALWPGVVDLVRAENALIGALIAEAQPVAVAGDDLDVAFAATAQFLKKKAESPANRAIVTDALSRLTGRRWRISYELREQLDDANGAGSGTGSYSEEEWVERLKTELDAEEIPLERESRQSPRESVLASSPDTGSRPAREHDVTSAHQPAPTPAQSTEQGE
jgi:DNA polymerase-3 subunit gamma/tau